jgi:serpin B
MPFDPAQTRTEPFITAEGKKVAVFMMNRAGRFNYMENEALQALEIPYAGNAVSMIFLLPKDRNTLSALEAELSQEMIQTLFAQMESRPVSVSMPRFQIGSSFDLSQPLTSLGMVAAFSRHADFSGMDGAQNLFLSAVLHKARIEVNEKGAEAAAATAVIVFEKTAFERTPVFRADHPFLFMIRENKRGELLFLGRVMDPNGEQPL